MPLLTARGGGQRRRRHERNGMAAAAHGLDDSPEQDPAEADDKKIGRHAEDHPGLADPSQVDQRDDGEDAQAERQRMGLQPWQGRGQRGHSRRDADGHVEHVVEHQRRGREQARIGAEVFLGHDVGAAPVGIGGDRLPVGEVKDGQQRQNRPGDGNQVAQPDTAEGQEDRQGGFGAVSRRRKSVQTQGGDTRPDADLLTFFFATGQRPPEQVI
jgi:hypothetical protein